MKFKLLVIIFLIAFSFSALSGVNVGILAKRGGVQCMQQWGDLGKYLTTQIGTDVRIVPLAFVEVDSAISTKKIDFLLTNSSMFANMNTKYGLSPVATMINTANGKAVKEFGGVIISKAGSSIKTISDIKSKSFMCVKKSSFGGCQMAWREMLAKGVDIEKDVKFSEGQKHDNVALAVKAGTVDAGTVRTDTLERMQDEGTIKISEFTIINEQKDSFPFVRSTKLYPEWPIAALGHADKEIVKKITAALLALKKDDPAAKNAQIVGWSAPLDYAPVNDLLKEIKYNISE